MLTFGAIVVLSGLGMMRGDRSGVLAVQAIALCYFLFGVVAFYFQSFNHHFLGFAIVGLLAGGSSLGTTT